MYTSLHGVCMRVPVMIKHNIDANACKSRLRQTTSTGKLNKRIGSLPFAVLLTKRTSLQRNAAA